MRFSSLMAAISAKTCLSCSSQLIVDRVRQIDSHGKDSLEGGFEGALLAFFAARVVILSVFFSQISITQTLCENLQRIQKQGIYSIPL